MPSSFIARSLVATALLILPAQFAAGQDQQPGKLSAAEAERLDKEATQLNALVVKLINQRKLLEAEPLARKALEIRRRVFGSDHLAVAQSEYNLAFLLNRAGRPAEAEPLYLNSLKTREAGKEFGSASTCLHMLGRMYRDMGRDREALAMLERGLKIREDIHGKDSIGVAHILNDLGQVHRRAGRSQDAEALFKRSVQVCAVQKVVNHAELAHSIDYLAAVYTDLGKLADAEAQIQRALKIREDRFAPTDPGIANNLCDLGALYVNLGRYEEAEKLMQRALKIRDTLLAQNPDDKALLAYKATILCNLGLICTYNGRLEDAERFALRGLAINEGILARFPKDADAKREMASMLNNLGILLSRRKKFAEAATANRRSLQLAEELHGPDHPTTMVTLTNLGKLYSQLGHYQEAESLFLRALKSQREKLGPNHPNIYHCLRNLACLYQATGRTREAVSFQVQTLQIQEILLHATLAVSSERDMLAMLEASSGLMPQLLTMAAEGEKEALAPALTWMLRRQGIVFDTLLRFRQAQALLPPGDPLTAKAGRFRQVQQLLANTALNPPRELSAEQFAAQRKAWQKEADVLQAELSRALAERHPDQVAPAAAMDASSMHKRLPAGSALVIFVPFGPYDFKATGTKPSWLTPRYYAMILTADSAQPRLIDLGISNVIDKAVAVVRDKFDQGQGLDANTEEAGEEEYKVAAKALYQLVFAKVRPELGKAKMIYLSVEGELSRVPLEALVDEHNKYLIESYRFAYQSAGRDLLRAKPAQPGKGTVVFAGPDYDMTLAQRFEKVKGVAIAKAPDKKTKPGDNVSAWMRDLRSGRWRALKGAAAEADDVRQALGKSEFGPVKVFAGSDALEESFKQVKSPRILHVATHGFYLPEAPSKNGGPAEEADAGFGAARGMSRLRAADNPLLRSGLILAGANLLGSGEGEGDLDVDDGWVTAAEIAHMDLHGTELVVLSACETGLGKEVRGYQGEYGLRRAFLYAGARTLVNSLFVVPDAQTRDLMKHFYANLQKGQGKLAALHGAEIEMIRQRRAMSGAAHPFFWASFVLVGDPD